MKKSKLIEDQIVRILEEAEEGEKSQGEVFRGHGLSQNMFYLWNRKYSGLQMRDRVHQPGDIVRIDPPIPWRKT